MVLDDGQLDVGYRKQEEKGAEVISRQIVRLDAFREEARLDRFHFCLVPVFPPRMQPLPGRIDMHTLLISRTVIRTTDGTILSPMTDSAVPPGTTIHPPAPVPPDATGEVATADESLPFPSTPERKFELYMQQRQGYTTGARDAYQRFDQTIVALSGGSIVLSISFMKDIGHVPESLLWLFASWGSFLIASLSAFISLLTSGESDREWRTQLDCSVWDGTCDESRAEKYGRWTSRLNYSALSFCILGVILIIMFATYNLLHNRGKSWQKDPPNAETSVATTENKSTTANPSPSGNGNAPPDAAAP